MRSLCKRLKLSATEPKGAFYNAVNALYCKVKYKFSDIVMLKLIALFCRPLLIRMYHYMPGYDSAIIIRRIMYYGKCVMCLKCTSARILQGFCLCICMWIFQCFILLIFISNMIIVYCCSSAFLRATAGTAIARLSHRNSVCLSVCPSVTRVDQAKTVQVGSSYLHHRLPQDSSFRICNAFPKIP